METETKLEFDSKYADTLIERQDYSLLMEHLNRVPMTEVLADWLAKHGYVDGHVPCLYLLIRNYIKPGLTKRVPVYEHWFQVYICRLIVMFFMRIAEDVDSYQRGFGTDGCSWIYSHLRDKICGWARSSVPELETIPLTEVIDDRFQTGIGRNPVGVMPAPVWVETFRKTPIPGCTSLYWNSPLVPRRQACYDVTGTGPVTTRITDMRENTRALMFAWCLEASQKRTMAHVLTFDMESYTTAARPVHPPTATAPPQVTAQELFDKPPPTRF